MFDLHVRWSFFTLLFTCLGLVLFLSSLCCGIGGGILVISMLIWEKYPCFFSQFHVFIRVVLWQVQERMLSFSISYPCPGRENKERKDEAKNEKKEGKKKQGKKKDSRKQGKSRSKMRRSEKKRVSFVTSCLHSACVFLGEHKMVNWAVERLLLCLSVRDFLCLMTVSGICTVTV